MTKVFRKIPFLKAALAAALVTLFAGTAAAVAIVEPHLPASTAHGEGFRIESWVDTSYCIDVEAGATQGRALTLSACSSNATELWTFTKNSDGSNLFVDSQGMCVDSVGRKAGDGVSVKVRNCSFVQSQRFRYTSLGRIQLSGTAACLSIPRAGAAAPLFLETCSNSNPRQLFKLTL
jgi:hypothetical protein